MKNQNKGFIVPVLIGIIALLIIGGGVYVYETKKTETPVSTSVQVQQSNQVQQMNTQIPPATITLDLSSSFVRQFKTVLSEAFKKPANFDEHYTVAEIGCGTGCFTFVVIDKNTGKVYPAPIGNDIGQFTGNIGQPYSLHSNKIKIIAKNGSRINTYTFTGSSFSLLSSENTQSDVSTKPSIIVLSPNGGENWKIGSQQTIRWNLQGNIPSGYKLGIYLGGGFITQLNAGASNTYTLTVPSSLFHGDYSSALIPGKYKVNAILYDGDINLGNGNPNYQWGKVVAQDSSDTDISITN